jgi:mannitol 2-dehydrogenase
MVDRITPQTVEADAAEVLGLDGVYDRCPVVTESFTQWVLEDRFGGPRPEFEQAGVELVDDVGPYELMKLRLLNLSHQAIAYFGRLMDYQFVSDAIRDPLIADFVLGFMKADAAPSLPEVPGIDIGGYEQTLLRRFGNTAIKDTVARLASDASDRIPKWLVPLIRERLAVGADVAHSAAIIASWARFAQGVDERGKAIEVNDRRAEDVRNAARQQEYDRLAFLRQPSLFGTLVAEPRFTEPYLRTLNGLRDLGVRATLERLAAGQR